MIVEKLYSAADDEVFSNSFFSVLEKVSAGLIVLTVPLDISAKVLLE